MSISLFQWRVIADGGAFGHIAGYADDTGTVQQGLDQRGLAAAALADQGDVADGVDGIGVHGRGLGCAVSAEELPR